jgi:hypothetical protein
MNQAGSKMLPFRMSTRQRIQQVGVVDMTIGGQSQLELPRVGYLAGIILNCYGTMTLGGVGVYGPYGIHNLLKRISVNVNTGQALIYDTSGFGAKQVNARMLRDGFNPVNSELYSAPTANGANSFDFSLYIPIAINDSLLFHLGLISLQAPDVRCTVDLRYASAGADVVTNFTSISNAKVSVHYVYYDVVNPNQVQVPPLVLHRILEDRKSITATGDQVYEVPRGGTIMQMVHIVTLNNAIANIQVGSSNIDGARLMLNRTETIYNETARSMRLWQALKNGGSNPVGDTIDWNLFDAGDNGVGSGDFRDTLDSEQISTLESIVTVNSGATVGAVAYLDVLRRIYQPMVA